MNFDENGSMMFFLPSNNYNSASVVVEPQAILIDGNFKNSNHYVSYYIYTDTKFKIYYYNDQRFDIPMRIFVSLQYPRRYHYKVDGKVVGFFGAHKLDENLRSYGYFRFKDGEFLPSRLSKCLREEMASNIIVRPKLIEYREIFSQKGL